MTDENINGEPTADEPVNLLRTQDFDTPRPIELDLGNATGSVQIELAETALTHVEIRHDPGSGAFDWREGVAGLLSWVSDRFSEAGVPQGTAGERPKGEESWDRRSKESAAAAVRQTRVELTGGRLVVRTPESAPLRLIPLSITVRAPRESRLGLRTGSGAVTVTGSAGRVDIHSGGGAVNLERATGKATVNSGSGAVHLGQMAAEVHVRSGSGDIEITSLSAASSVGSSTGNVWLGELSGDVLVRTGSGDVTVADAAAGQVELITGSGEVRIAVRQGVTAEVDLTSSTGSASSELSVSEEPPEEQPGLQIFARTGNGNAVLTPSL